MSRLHVSNRSNTLVVAIAMLAALMPLTGDAHGARGGQTYALSFVSATPGTPYGVAKFDVERQPSKRTNLYRVQLVVRCDPAGYVGDWTYTGESVWVSASGDPVAISGSYYPDAPCQAWVYQVGASGGYLNPDSNVVPFVGP